MQFEPTVIQFPNDDLTDPEGLWSGLAEDIAAEIFDIGDEAVNFCTARAYEDIPI